jgi:tripartite-type tricarboxylate transporter receptor subunit TctC
MRMTIPRRRFLQLASAAAALPALPRPAHAQSFPSRFVRLIVPFPPGGGGDALARPLAQRLSEVWGQQVIVENKGGAGGNVGAYQAANSPADGYTLLLGAAFFSINPYLYPNSGYNPATDLAPVTLLTVIPNVMMVPNSSPAKTVQEFIDYAKANRGKVTFASTGVGASPHLSGELFKRMAGIEMTHVPYRGAGPAMNDLIPGRVDAMFSNLPGVISQVSGKAVRGLAVTTAERNLAAPDIPTIGETVAGYEVSTWWALYVPARTPADIIAKIHSDAAAALTHPLVKQRYEAIGAPATPSTPAELTALMKTDLDKWGPIIKEIGIKPE